MVLEPGKGRERTAVIREALAGPLQRSDITLWAAVALLAAFGLVSVHSSTLGEPPHPLLTIAALRHAVIAIAGAAMMLFAARFDYRLLRPGSAALYVLAIGLLLLALVAGETEYGARRWLTVGGATFQPAELAKLALVVALASYASVRTPRLPALLVTFALLAGLLLPVLTQPDTGSALIFTSGWLVVVVVWGTSLRMLGGLFAGLAGLMPLTFALAVPDYQRERIAVFLNPERDPLGTGYTLRQAETALAEGGITGSGLFGGSESHLYGILGRSSDFVFAMIGEELGLIGTLAVLVLFGLIGWRGLEAARHAPDSFGRLLASGLTALLLAQAMLNMAVNVRLFPATGLPLPFISQGGTALLATFIAVGLLQSIYAHRAPPRLPLSEQPDPSTRARAP